MSLAGCSSALADHGGDLTAGIPLWQLIAAGAFAVGVMLTATRIRDRIRRRPSAAPTGDPPSPAQSARD
jgi:hypothetical protein